MCSGKSANKIVSYFPPTRSNTLKSTRLVLGLTSAMSMSYLVVSSPFAAESNRSTPSTSSLMYSKSHFRSESIIVFSSLCLHQVSIFKQHMNAHAGIMNIRLPISSVFTNAYLEYEQLVEQGSLYGFGKLTLRMVQYSMFLSSLVPIRKVANIWGFREF